MANPKKKPLSNVVEGFLVSGFALGIVGAMMGYIPGLREHPDRPWLTMLDLGGRAFLGGGLIGALVASAFDAFRRWREP